MGRSWPLPPLDGVPLGLWDTTSYETAATCLQPGDRLVLYTDGLTEARNSQGDFFGVEPLEGYLRQAGETTPEALVRGIVDEVQSFAEATPQTDDITVLALLRTKESQQ